MYFPWASWTTITQNKNKNKNRTTASGTL